MEGRLGEVGQKSKEYYSTLPTDLVLLNVSGESTAKELWDNLENLYQSKSLVNKLFLREKLYHLRMEDGDYVTEHLNSFNTLVSQLGSVDIMIPEEDKCITLLCSDPDGYRWPPTFSNWLKTMF